MKFKDLTSEDIQSFLKSGAIIGLGLENCLVAWGEPKRSAKPSGAEQEFYTPDFYLEEKKPWVTFKNTFLAKRAQLIQELDRLAVQPKLDLDWHPPQFDEFKNKFELIKNAIKTKELRKAVPVVFAEATSTVTLSMRAAMLAHLLKAAQKPTPYGFWTPDEGVLGATPEVLFSYDAKHAVLETMALAGTRASALEAASSLQNDPKEMFEHDLVIKGLREKLAPLGDLQVSPTYVWDLGMIAHLRTDMSVEINGKPSSEKMFSDICSLLHPTAALGVSPNRADWRFLKKCDGDQDRRRFGAPFGVLNVTGKSIVMVAIRNIQWREDHILLGTGCGVVAQSQLQNEWEELEVKRKSVRALLGI